MTNVNVQQLTAEAALTGDPEHIVHALALDPLTAAVCTLQRDPRDGHRDARGAAAVAARVPGRTIRPTPTISIPPDVVPVEVPLDPALAIHKRFGKLVEQKTDR